MIGGSSHSLLWRMALDSSGNGERITFYDLRTTEVEAFEDGSDGFVVNLTVEAQKVYADSLGAETEAPLDHWIEVGVFADADEEEVLYLQRHRITSGTNTIEIRVPSMPKRAGIDPYGKLLDRKNDDNVLTIAPPVLGATSAP